MTSPPSAPRGFHLLDLTALVVGYSLAALLVRAFWPYDEPPPIPSYVVLGLAYAWLGLAMSGPVVLLGRRRAAATEDDQDAAPTRTWSELAWLIIGFYWIGLTMFVVPARLPATRTLDSAFLGLFPILAAVVLRVSRPRLPAESRGEPDWTHRASVGLLLTWPIAWVAMILLGKGLP